ncbi:MAG: hypothetical protein CVU00_08265 [Bacteroidetes bacterium HGW-Bacteroidetes-17]|jgi:hypothetical protein|nr:MAG: hypothetical protein CVU00_08265 [Bacteroidetes bacterium HGW-Bacteroidetes-17]
MQNITSVAELKNAIQVLELDQTVKGQLLKEQLLLTYDNYRPINIIRRALKDLGSSPNLIDNILSTTIGLGTGFLTKKIVVGSSHNIFRSLLGSIMQLSITNLVARNPDALKSIGLFIFQHIFNKKEMNT